MTIMLDIDRLPELHTLIYSYIIHLTFREFDLFPSRGLLLQLNF
jgi:hypothetical protein